MSAISNTLRSQQAQRITTPSDVRTDNASSSLNYLLPAGPEGLKSRATEASASSPYRNTQHPAQSKLPTKDQSAPAQSDRSSLSERKQKFLAQTDDTTQPVSLSFSDLKTLSNHYNNKHGTAIHIAGEVNPSLLQNQQEEITQEWQTTLSKILSTPNPTAELHQLWNKVSSIAALQPLVSAVAQESRSVRELMGLTSSRSDKTSLLIDALSHLMPRAIEQRSLSNKSCTQELKTLARHPNGAAHGYLVPTRQLNRHGYSHAEAFIVSSAGAIINPLPSNESNVPKLKYIYDTDFTSFTDLKEAPSPQGSKRGCGTFAMSYLKEYLKENGKQLNQNTLLVDVKYKKSREKLHFPSPNVLERAQSECHSKIAHAMVKSQEDTTQIHHKGHEIEVLTLAGLQRGGATFHYPDGTPAGDTLPAYKSNWLAQYQVTQERRAQMTVNGRNHSAAYTSRRLSEKASALTAPSTSGTKPRS